MSPKITSNIASHLPGMAQRHPDKPAVVMPVGRKDGRAVWATLSYAELDARSDAYARGLERVGIKRGVRTVLMVKPSLDFFALVFALYKVGAILVLIDPGIPRAALAKCLREVEPQAFVGVPIAHIARLVFGKALASVRINVTVGRRWFWGGHRLCDLADDGGYEMADTQPDEVAAVLFTSGSTGIPKGAVYTHGNFDAQVQMLEAIYRFDADEVDLATFPLFALFDPALGMTSVVPDMDARKPGSADPAKIIEAIEAHGCTNMFGSPALLRNLGRYGVEHKIELPSLRRVLSAGAPARREILQDVSHLLREGVEIFTPYGATESLPVANIGSIEVLGETYDVSAKGGGICVGKPVDGMTVRVIRITDDAISTWSDELIVPQGTIGEITVRGPVVTEEYFGRPDQTHLAKIHDGKHIVHRMGDVGYFDETGRLWMCGRKSHRVETADGPLYTIPIERIFDEHPAVRQTALVGVGPRGAQQAILLVERQPGHDMSDDALLDALRTLGQTVEAARVVTTIRLYPNAFPVDIRHNAKISREQLADWAAEKSQP